MEIIIIIMLGRYTSGTKSVLEGGGGGGIVIRFRDKRLPPTKTADKISWHWYTARDLPGAFLGASRDPYRNTG